MVLKELILNSFYLAGCGSLERILAFSTLAGCGGLARTDFSVSTFGVSLTRTDF